jgi:hypothetical protein
VEAPAARSLTCGWACGPIIRSDMGSLLFGSFRA